MAECNVWHYDGKSAVERSAALVIVAGGFRLEGEGIAPDIWPFNVLVALESGDKVYGHKSLQGWRIGFVGDVPDDVAALLPAPAKYGGMIDSFGLGKFSVVAACVAAVLVFTLAKSPEYIAPLVPQSFEDNLGDGIIGDFGGRYCHTPAGDAALQKLIRKIDPDRHARTIGVANIDMVNAVAIPGRHILIFRGLVENAKSSNEVAGVLGHELGHVYHRHTMAALIRQMGLLVLLGGTSGGQQLNDLVSLSFSREAESEADKFAIERLNAAQISPLGVAAFFKELAEMEKRVDFLGEGGKWFSSHPDSEGRAKFFSKSHRKEGSYTPALTEAEWKALQSMCADDKNVKSGWDTMF